MSSQFAVASWRGRERPAPWQDPTYVRTLGGQVSAAGSYRILVAAADGLLALAVEPRPSGVIVETTDLPTLLAGLRTSRGARFAAGPDATIEIEAPPLPWMTTWVAEHDHGALATTSLHAAAFLLGGLDLDEHAAPAMLLTGTLGPERSWDRRVQQLPGGTVATIGAGRLTLAPTNAGPTSAPTRSSDDDARADLEAAIRRSLAAGHHDGWTLPLSGGVDSRALLLLGPPDRPTITWGTRASADDPWSDTAIARRLAEATGTEHEFLELDGGVVAPAEILGRFARASEGRIDHLGGYLDGMAMWSGLRERGVQGILRGDEYFGWVGLRRTETGYRRVIGAIGPDDLVEAPVVSMVGTDTLWTSPREATEPLPAYRDRLVRSFRAPAVLAPLNHVKAHHVAVSCPFLAPDLIDAASALSARQRDDKRLFTDLVRRLRPDIPFARRSSLPTGRFDALPGALDLLGELLAGDEHDVVPTELRRLLEPSPRRVPAEAARPRPAGGRAALTNLARRAVPHRLVVRAARRRADAPLELDLAGVRLRAALAIAATASVRDAGRAGARWISPGSR